MTAVHGDESGTLLGLEVNYGVTDHLQLHSQLPFVFDRPSIATGHIGAGDSEIGFKYRFVDDDENGWIPDVGIAPTLILPSGSESRNLGTGHVHTVFPFLVAKSFHRWAVFGSLGYVINPGLGHSDWWLAGIGATYRLIPDLDIGLDVFHTQSTSIGPPPSTTICIGAKYTMNHTHHPMLSIGRSVQNASQTNQLSIFIADQITF